MPKITRSGDNSPAVSQASSDRGSGKRGGFLRSRKQVKGAPAQVTTAQEDDLPSPSLEEAPVIRDQAIRGSLHFSIQTAQLRGCGLIIWTLRACTPYDTYG